MYRNQDGWFNEYHKKDAIWIHDGIIKRPHALLTSGNHSSGFFNSRKVIPDEYLLKEAASDLLELFTQQGGDISRVEIVVGPQTGATKLAELLGAKISMQTGNDCISSSPAKREIAGQKFMEFTEKDLDLLLDRSALLCDDVLTTFGSLNLTATAVEATGGTVLPFLLVLVNRSGLISVGGKRIISLINHPMPTWIPEECPLCREGSEAIPAKGNWDRLNADY